MVRDGYSGRVGREQGSAQVNYKEMDIVLVEEGERVFEALFNEWYFGADLMILSRTGELWMF